MSNKLKILFDDTSEQCTGKINFDSKEAADAFELEIKNIYRDGQPKEIKNVSYIKLNEKDGDNIYSTMNACNIKKCVVGIAEEKIKFPVVIDGRKDEVILYKKVLSEKIVLDTRNDAVIEMHFTFPKQGEEIEYNYATHIDKANDLKELIEGYKRALALIKNIFAQNTEVPELNSMIRFFNGSINSFVRIKELTDMLKIAVTPSEITEINDDDYIIEKLYLLLVKSTKIRINDKLTSVTAENVTDNLDKNLKGNTLLATYTKKWDVHLFNTTFTIYTANCVFNAIVSDIKDDGAGNRKIYFIDRDSKPMYCAYSAYMNKEDAEAECAKALHFDETYANALEFPNLLRELINEN